MRVAGTMKEAPKIKMPWAVKCRLNKLVLMENMGGAIKNEKPIYKQVLFNEVGTGSVEIMYLAPGAQVYRHQHTTNMEIYISWNQEKHCLKVETCRKGEEHELVNKSEKRWAWVISIKIDRP